MKQQPAIFLVACLLVGAMLCGFVGLQAANSQIAEYWKFRQNNFGVEDRIGTYQDAVTIEQRNNAALPFVACGGTMGLFMLALIALTQMEHIAKVVDGSYKIMRTAKKGRGGRAAGGRQAQPYYIEQQLQLPTGGRGEQRTQHDEVDWL